MKQKLNKKRLLNKTQLLPKNSTKGMTLMEALVALLILSLISVAVLTTLRASSSVTKATDVLVHFENIENVVIPRFKEDPTMTDLSPIMPLGSIQIDENTYEVYYDSSLSATSDTDDSEYMVRFTRRLNEDPKDGFNITSREVELGMDVYRMGEDAEWYPYTPTMSNGTNGVGLLDLSIAPTIPGGGSTHVGTLTVESINATTYYKGKSVGNHFELPNIKPGVLISEYMQDFTFEPYEGIDESTLKYEIKNTAVEGGWETLTDFDVAAGLDSVVRISYEEQKNLNLILQIPSALDSLDRSFSVTIDTVPFSGGHTALTESSVAQLTGHTTYDAIFKKTLTDEQGRVIPLDYTTVEWVEISTGDILTFEELQAGISLYTQDSQETLNPVINKARFQNKTYVATASALPIELYDLTIRVVGFSDHAYIKNGIHDYVVPQVEEGFQINILDMTRLIFGESTVLTDFRYVPDIGSIQLVEYTDGFGGSTVTGIEDELNSGFVTMDKDRFIEITYEPHHINLGIMLQQDNGDLVDTGKTLTIRVDYDNEITSNKLTSALSQNIENYFGSDYIFQGAFIDSVNRLNTPVTVTDQGKAIVLKYNLFADNPLYLNIKVNGEDLPEAFTDVTVVNLSFVKKHGLGGGLIENGVALKLEEVSRTLQASPPVTTIPRTQTVDFQYSINDDMFQNTPLSITQWGDRIKAAYAQGNYTGIVVRFYLDYDYVDMATLIEEHGILLGTEANGNLLNASEVPNLFTGQGATFKPVHGRTTDIENGKITYFGEGADAGLISLLNIHDVPFKFQSHASPDVKEDIIAEQYGRNITLLWDVSGMESIAKSASQATNSDYRGKVGLLPLGNDQYRFSYQQKGVELMEDANIITIPGGLNALDKITLIIHRVQPNGAYNYYGAWQPLFGADASTYQSTLSDGASIDHIYNMKEIYTGVDLVSGSIPINNLDLVYGSCFMVLDAASVFEPAQFFSHDALLPYKEHNGRLISLNGTNMIYSLSDLPTADETFTTSEGTPRTGHPTGYLLGAGRSAFEQSQIMSVPFDYTDLTKTFSINVALAGGLTLN